MPAQSESQPSSAFSSGWASSLPEPSRLELARLLTPKTTKYIPHSPHPTQAAFLLLDDVREILFGGAAGGGKSDALLMAALQYVDRPNYSAILLRRTFPDLNQPGALIPRSKEWLMNTDARWNGVEHSWTFPGGAVVKFGHLQHENDVYQYQGAEFQFIGFDELTQFSQFMYDYMHSRLRKTEGSRVPLRIRCSANPGGEGHEWVKRHFMDEAAVNGAVFIPSQLEDNPSLDKTEYERSLAAIADPVLRAQLRHGDWNVRPAGKLFRKEWFQVVDEVPSGLRWKRYWDMAATEEKKKPGRSATNDPDWTAGAKVAVEMDDTGAFEVWVADVRRIRATPAGVEAFIRSTARDDGRDVEIWIEQEPGSSGVTVVDNYVRRVLFGWPVRGDRVTGDKHSRWAPLSAQAQAGNVRLLRGDWNGWWLEEAQAAPQPGVHDDGLDAVSGALAQFLDPQVSTDGGFSVGGERRM